jgi:hypothetical protein
MTASSRFVQAPISSVLTDKSGYIVDATNPLPVNPAESGAVNMAATQVTVTNSATQIVAANTTRRAVVIVNTDASNAVFIGGAAVTASTGIKLAAGASISIPTVAAVYGITSSSTAVVGELEVYD